MEGRSWQSYKSKIDLVDSLFSEDQNLFLNINTIINQKEQITIYTF